MACKYNDCGWCSLERSNYFNFECPGYGQCNMHEERLSITSQEGKEKEGEQFGNLREYESTTYLIPKELLLDFDADITALYEKEEERVNKSGRLHEYENEDTSSILEELAFLQVSLDMKWDRYRVEGELYDLDVLMPEDVKGEN